MIVTERILHVGGEVRVGYTKGTLLTLHSDLSGSAHLLMYQERITSYLSTHSSECPGSPGIEMVSRGCILIIFHYRSSFISQQHTIVII